MLTLMPLPPVGETMRYQNLAKGAKRLCSNREFRTALIIGGVLLIATTLCAEDLEGAAQTASDSMKRIFKIGATLVGSIGVVGGLITAAFKFFGKKEDATWWLVCAGGGAVIVTMALTLL